MQRSPKFVLALVSLGSLVASPALAQTLASDALVEARSTYLPFADSMETPRGMAMGLGARASATGTSGIAYNAAGMSIGHHYQVESSVGYEPQAERFAVGSAVVDSYSGPVNAGVNFRYVQGNGYEGHGGYDGRVALGVPIGDNFALGATGRYLSFWREGQSGAPMWAEGFTFDASIRVTPIAGLHIAALGENILDIGSPLAPLRVGGSASYTFDNTFTLAFDGLADLSTWHNQDGTIQPEAMFGGAAEYFTGEVPIRAGYIYDTGRDTHFVTAGVGYTNPEFALDLALRQQVTAELHTWLLLSFRYFVH